MDKQEYNIQAWTIAKHSGEPEKCEIIKQTKKQCKIRRFGLNGIETISNDEIFDSYSNCRMECAKIAYKNLSVHAKCCSDLMEKIQKLDGF